MDLLLSINLEDLPEQQTRTVELMERYPDFDGQLGFDCCCHCGTSFSSSLASAVVPCPSCRRVKYCSEACRIADASAATTVMLKEEDRGNDDDNSMNGGEDEETAMGHTAVVCALLSLCDDDEAVESGDTKKAAAATGGGDRRRWEAARDRVRSEDESYPATLANVLAEGPCYQHVIAKYSRRRRRPNGNHPQGTDSKLVLHVVGASVDSELWGGFDLDEDLSHAKYDPVEGSVAATNVPCLRAYAEALAELNVPDIELVFVGPECPSTNLDRRLRMKRLNDDDDCDYDDTGSGRDDGELVVRSIQGTYSADLLESIGMTAKPDIVVFFNPGFTVPDYEWRETLATIQAGTPFLFATNTELEGIADCQYLLEQDKIQALPPGLADVLGLYSTPDDNDDGNDSHNPNPSESAFFSVNPFAGNRVRQSGTMANDLYVKNRWILGGVMDQFDPSRRTTSSTAGGAPTTFGGKKKQRTSPEGSTENSKASNPALI